MFYELESREVDEHVKFKTHLEKEWLYEYLVGPNDKLDEVHDRILAKKPSSSFREAFVKVLHEEKGNMLKENNHLNQLLCQEIT